MEDKMMWANMTIAKPMKARERVWLPAATLFGLSPAKMKR